MQRMLVLMLVAAVSVVLASGAQADRLTVQDTTAVRLVTDAVTDQDHVAVTLQAMPTLPEDYYVAGIELTATSTLLAGTTLELWAVSETEGEELVDTWTLDARTGTLVLFRIPEVLKSGTTYEVRLDPADVAAEVELTSRSLQDVTRTVTQRKLHRRAEVTPEQQ